MAELSCPFTVHDVRQPGAAATGACLGAPRLSRPRSAAGMAMPHLDRAPRCGDRAGHGSVGMHRGTVQCRMRDCTFAPLSVRRPRRHGAAAIGYQRGIGIASGDGSSRRGTANTVRSILAPQGGAR